jgi:exopolyphosphatase/pppGpp-phosphohydrolase
MKLNAVGFTDVEILSTTDEGKMEARAATTINSSNGVVFAAGGGSTQVTLA